MKLLYQKRKKSTLSWWMLVGLVALLLLMPWPVPRSMYRYIFEKLPPLGDNVYEMEGVRLQFWGRLSFSRLAIHQPIPMVMHDITIKFMPISMLRGKTKGIQIDMDTWQGPKVDEILTQLQSREAQNALKILRSYHNQMPGSWNIPLNFEKLMLGGTEKKKHSDTITPPEWEIEDLAIQLDGNGTEPDHLNIEFNKIRSPQSELKDVKQEKVDESKLYMLTLLSHGQLDLKRKKNKWKWSGKSRAFGGEVAGSGIATGSQKSFKLQEASLDFEDIHGKDISETNWLGTGLITGKLNGSINCETTRSKEQTCEMSMKGKRTYFSNFPFQKSMLIQNFMPELDTMQLKSLHANMSVDPKKIEIDSVWGDGSLAFNGKGKIHNKGHFDLRLECTLDKSEFEHIDPVVKEVLRQDEDGNYTFVAHISGNRLHQRIEVEKAVSRFFQSVGKKIGNGLRSIWK